MMLAPARAGNTTAQLQAARNASCVVTPPADCGGHGTVSGCSCVCAAGFGNDLTNLLAPQWCVATSSTQEGRPGVSPSPQSSDGAGAPAASDTGTPNGSSGFMSTRLFWIALSLLLMLLLAGGCWCYVRVRRRRAKQRERRKRKRATSRKQRARHAKHASHSGSTSVSSRSTSRSTSRSASRSSSRSASRSASRSSSRSASPPAAKRWSSHTGSGRAAARASRHQAAGSSEDEQQHHSSRHGVPAKKRQRLSLPPPGDPPRGQAGGGARPSLQHPLPWAQLQRGAAPFLSAPRGSSGAAGGYPARPMSAPGDWGHVAAAEAHQRRRQQLPPHYQRQHYADGSDDDEAASEPRLRPEEVEVVVHARGGRPDGRVRASSSSRHVHALQQHQALPSLPGARRGVPSRSGGGGGGPRSRAAASELWSSPEAGSSGFFC